MEVGEHYGLSFNKHILDLELDCNTIDFLIFTHLNLELNYRYPYYRCTTTSQFFSHYQGNSFNTFTSNGATASSRKTPRYSSCNNSLPLPLVLMPGVLRSSPEV